MQQVILNNKKYRYTVKKNDNTSQVAIFLLGALQDIESVNQFSEAFSNTLTCITVEIPGTGYAERLDAKVSIRDQSQMLLDFIDFMKIDSAHIIGFSYATAISVELCALWAGVKSLSICGGVPGIPDSGLLSTKKMIASAMQNKSDFADSFISSLTVDNSSIPRSRVIKKAMQKSISRLPDDRIQMFFDNSIRLLVHTPSCLEAIHVPAIVCAAEHDPYVTTEVAKQFASSLRNSRYIEIKNADHLVHLEHPELVAKILIIQAAADVNVEQSLQSLTS